VSDSTEVEKLQTYREEVSKELQARSERLRSLDQRIEQHQRNAGAHTQEYKERIGGAQAILAQEAYRRRIGRELERLKEERKEAAADVARAQERLALVEEEIVSLMEAEVGSELEKTPDGEKG
jgi:hypothetical protein